MVSSCKSVKYFTPRVKRNAIKLYRTNSCIPLSIWGWSNPQLNSWFSLHSTLFKVRYVNILAIFYEALHLCTFYGVGLKCGFVKHNTVRTPFFLFKLASLRQVQQSDYVKQSRLSMTKLRGRSPEITGLIPIGGRNSYLHHRVQQVTGARRASFRIGMGIPAVLKW
jgi:hypothetical protein